MRRFWKWLLALAAALLLTLPAQAADTSNREAGYFENTRTVLLLPAVGRNGYAAAFLDREMNRIFRYPYYRLVDSSERPAGPDAMRAAAVAAGADIAVMPVAARSPCSATGIRWSSPMRSLSFTTGKTAWNR